MKFRFVFWDVLQCKMIVEMMESARTSGTSVNNYFTRQYIPEDKSELVYFGHPVHQLVGYLGCGLPLCSVM
jgi:hypothetical protein